MFLEHKEGPRFTPKRKQKTANHAVLLLSFCAWKFRLLPPALLQKPRYIPHMEGSPSPSPRTYFIAHPQSAGEQWESRSEDMHNTHTMLLAQRKQIGEQEDKEKARAKIYFFHSRMQCSAGILHTWHNTLKESTYTCFSKTSTSVLHGSLSTA